MILVRFLLSIMIGVPCAIVFYLALAAYIAIKAPSTYQDAITSILLNTSFSGLLWTWFVCTVVVFLISTVFAIATRARGA